MKGRVQRKKKNTKEIKKTIEITEISDLEKVLNEKVVSVKDILEKLQALHIKLSKAEQDNASKEKYLSVRHTLLSPTLMMHRNKGVKIYTACCLADIFRIFAPEAPFSENETMDIFEFFYKQLANLSVLTGPYFKFYFYLLESLANTKCLCLISQLKDTDDLVNGFTSTIFQTIRPEQSKNILVCLLDILEQVIDEAEHLPQECINEILENYKQNENKASRNLAINLCCNLPDKLQRYVCQYINSIIISTQAKENIDEFIEAHNLVLLMYKYSPEILLSVIPQLQEELTIENLVIRETATEILGKMFISSNSTLAKMYPQVWEAWIERSKDKKPSIRIKVLNIVKNILDNHPEVANSINTILKERSIDPDEKVRVETMSVISNLSLKALQYVDESIFKDCVSERCRDKKHIVRLEASRCLCHIYNTFYKEMFEEKINTGLFERYGWIPNTIIKLIYTDDKDILIMVEALINKYLIPEEYDNDKRVDRIINIVSSLDERGFLGFTSILNKQKIWSNFIEQFLQTCEKYNGGIIENIMESDEIIEKINKITKTLSNHFSEKKKSYDKLKLFIDLNDRRSYELLRNTYNSKSSYKKIMDSYKEITQREQLKSCMEEITIILNKVSLLIINKDVTSPLIKRIKEPLKQWSDKSYVSDWSNIGENASQRILKYITDNMPILYEDNIKLLSNLSETSLVTNTLEALSQIVKISPDKLQNNDKEFNEQLYNISLNGTAEQSKYSTYLLTLLDKKNELCEKLMKELMSDLTIKSKNLNTRLTSLGVLAKYANDLFESNDNGTKVVSFIIKDILLKNNTTLSSEQDIDEWVEYNNVDDECKLKCTSMKLMLKRIVASKNSSELAQTLAIPFIKLCRKLINNEGEIVDTDSTSSIQKIYLRLNAGLSLLKLAKHIVFESIITMNDFLSLTLIVQDTCAEVREIFSKKLLSLLYNRKIHIRYLPVLFLIAHEPEKELRDIIKSSLIRLTRSLKKNKNTIALMETLFLHFAHLLSHHSDINEYFNDETTLQQKFEILNIFSKYLEFYCDIVITRENISFVFYLSAQLKTYRDIYSSTSRELYLISDLAQYIIREKYVSSDWALLTYPGQFNKFPKSLYTKLSGEEAEKNISKLYIPTEYINQKSKKTENSKKTNRRNNHRKSKSKVEENIDSKITDIDSEKPKKDESSKENNISMDDNNHDINNSETENEKLNENEDTPKTNKINKTNDKPEVEVVIEKSIESEDEISEQSPINKNKRKRKDTSSSLSDRVTRSKARKI